LANIYIGCSGFLYDHWKGPFYPEKLSKSLWFEYYCKRFPSIELNVTFYRIPERETFTKWYLSTPDDFVISLKGSRFITHVRKLKDCEEPLEAFLTRASLLREKLGVILWQFPQQFPCNIERLSNFLDALKPYGMRHAFEFRNKTWITGKISKLLEKAGASLSMADWPPFLDELPLASNFVYIRRHGKEGNSDISYTSEETRNDLKRIKIYRKEGRDVFLYFNNDASGHAPQNAAELLALLRKKR
jgi:uncharacterized protein YecE (DUF72 family)